jgi:hypothetical protein
MERVKGIEPSSQAWEARILPLNHTRFPGDLLPYSCLARKSRVFLFIFLFFLSTLFSKIALILDYILPKTGALSGK